MNRRMLVAAAFVVTSLCASEAVYASPVAISAPVRAMFGKTKLVKFSVRNNTAAPLKLKCGETPMTVEAGKTADLQLPVGAHVTVDEATETHTAGSLLAEVTTSLSGATIVVR